MRSSKKRSDGTSKKSLPGRRQEKLAALFFEGLGFEILQRNWRAGRKEIDLIVKRDQLLVFVEVKSSRTAEFGHPSERVDRKKIANLTEVARQYLIAEKITDCDLRFDVVTFVAGQLEHYPNAFEATE